MVTIPPLGRESAIYVLAGEAGMWYGEGLRRQSPPCVGLIARTDPNEQESVTLLEVADPGIAGR
jgi:uncharacterized RmlC-like cupin family protein